MSVSRHDLQIKFELHSIDFWRRALDFVNYSDQTVFPQFFPKRLQIMC